MAISTVDAKQRVVLPAARPGDVFDIQSQGEGRLLLVRLDPPKPGPGMSGPCVKPAVAMASAMSRAALRMSTPSPWFLDS